MRLLFAASTILFLGCAGRVTVKNTQGEVRFDFVNGALGRDIEVLGITVYQVESGRRGTDVCALNLVAGQMRNAEKLRGWTYGKAVGGSYRLSECGPLVPDQIYGVAVHTADRRVVGVDFKINQDGSVVSLGAAKTSN